MVASWAGCLCPVLPPLSDILVLRLTRGSYRIYKIVVEMRNVLSQSDPSPLSCHRVTFSCRESASGCRAVQACYLEKQVRQNLVVMATL